MALSLEEAPKEKLPSISKKVQWLASPTFSMSEVRVHFWTLVARRKSGLTSPRKYGLNWFMPALASSRVGSLGISGLEGTSRWLRSTKKAGNRGGIWGAFMVWTSRSWVGLLGTARRTGPGR